MEAELQKQIELDATEGHLVLCCKGRYQLKEVNKVEALRRILGAFCGWNAVDNKSEVKYVADRLYDILRKSLSDCAFDSMQKHIHRDLEWGIGIPEELSAIEKMVWIYASRILHLKVKEKDEHGVYRELISLPEPEDELMNKIISGEFENDEYRKISEIQKKHNEK